MSEPNKKRFCVHFTGILQTRCMADVRYKDVRKDDPWRYPCMDRGTSLSGPELPCEARVWAGGAE